MTVQNLLQAHNYNSVGNFIRFYEELKNSNETNLSDFMPAYQPPITPQHHTCVGLSLTLLDSLKALDHRFPGLARSPYIASCQELVEDVGSCVIDAPDPLTVDKEHVLVALKVEVAGRKGLLLLDPGYQVARVVTVMEDELYPHTGWFTQSKEDHCKKDYNYVFSADCNHIIWMIKERRGSTPEKLSTSVIYVARPFLSPVDVTEKRNLVYNFRYLLSTDTKGHLTAGVYFPVTDSSSAQFTIFCSRNGVKQREKFNFSDFQIGKVINEKKQEMVEDTNKQLNFPPGQLFDILQKLANLLSDTEFISEVLLINKNINNMGKDK